MESFFFNFEYLLLFIIILFISTFKDITFILKTFYNTYVESIDLTL